MSQSRIEIKVGIFVLIGLLLLGGLTLLFSRSTAFYKSYYELRLISANVGGIKAGAKVLMRGVQVGSVSSTKLNEGGKNVTIFFKVESQYKLYSDAKFEIETSGFLGDQFISIYPTKDLGEILTNNSEILAREPFNMQEAVAVATEMIMKISQTTTNLNAAVSDVRRMVLTEQKLTTLGRSLDRIDTITAEAQVMMSRLSADAQDTMTQINGMVSNNAPPIATAVSNLNAFTSQLPSFANNVQSLVASNGAELSIAIKNLEIASVTLTNMMSDLQAGRGVAGRFLRDEQLAANLSAIVHNLSVTTSNLNTRGLWGIMWKQKVPAPTKSNNTTK
jgi:phospholipid/cholesterol/gamma-HCH transport system substrate-binding protein